MGLLDFKRGRTIDAEPSSNSNGSIMDNRYDRASLLGEAVIELFALVKAELDRREEARVADDPNEIAAIVTDKETKKRKGDL